MAIDVLLINPPFRLYPPFEYKLIDPPRNLALLAATLIKNGYTVKIFDMPILGSTFDDIQPFLEQEKPKSIGILNRSTYSFPIVCKATEIIKNFDADIPIIAGGTYVSFAPEEALKSCPDIDYIVLGEGEEPLLKLVNVLLGESSINEAVNIAYRDERGNIIFSQKAPPIEDLGSIPLPAIDLLPIDLYVRRNERYILDISRGCSNSCPYCTSSFAKNHIRYRPAHQVIDEISIAYKKGFRNFYFFDDVFTANKELVLEICKTIFAAKLDIKWPCMSRVDAIEEEMLEWMKKAGCDVIAFGVETASKKALEEVGKYDQLEKIQSAFALTKQYGIRALAFVIFGMPKNSFNDDLNSIKFLSELQPDAVGVFSFKPYPGTIYYNEPEKFGLKIFDRDFLRWSQLDEPTHSTEHMEKDQIIEAMLICNYLFRSGGSFSAGNKYRRKPGVLVMKTQQGGLLYNPYLPAEKRKTDMYLNGVKLDKMHFEVLYRCDGYHNLDDLIDYVVKIFNISIELCTQNVNEIIEKAFNMGILEIIPDVMAGKENFSRDPLIYGGGLV